QSLDLQWTQTYGGRDRDICNSMLRTDEDSLLIAGSTKSSGAGSSDFFLLKTNKEGEELWSETYGGQSADECRSIFRTEDNGLVLAGNTRSFGEGGFDFYCIKTDNRGGEIWSQTYGGNEDEECWSVVQTLDGGFALAGFTESYGEGGHDFWLVKTDEDGDEGWSQTYGGMQSDKCYSVVKTSDRGYALVGRTQSFGVGGVDGYLVKVERNGDEEWAIPYGGRSTDVFTSIIQTADGGYAIAGYTESYGEGGFDFWLVKTDDDGEQLWSKTFGGNASDECWSLFQTADGGFALAGYSESFGEGDSDSWLIVTDENGGLLWSTSFGGDSPEELFSVIQTSDGCITIAGYTESYGSGNLDMWVAKTEPLPPSWGGLADTSFLEDSPLVMSLDHFYDNIASPYYPDSVLNLSIQEGEYVSHELSNEEINFRAEPDWNGVDSLMFVVTNSYGKGDTTYQRLTVLPRNDLPGNFRLLFPWNNYVVDTTIMFFAWGEAAQKEWEIDDVSYTIHFQVGEKYHSVENLSAQSYTDLQIDSLASWLEFNLGVENIEVEWWVSAYDDSGFTDSDAHFKFLFQTEGIQSEKGNELPSDLVLSSVYPNPFNSITTIRYGLPSKSNVTIQIYNSKGQIVNSLFSGIKQPGYHTTTFMANDMPSGLYFIEVNASNQAKTQKVMLIR
ncbi:T9SS type A sorting domain-containing protein, partial [Calditrichota bacterium]